MKRALIAREVAPERVIACTPNIGSNFSAQLADVRCLEL